MKPCSYHFNHNALGTGQQLSCIPAIANTPPRIAAPNRRPGPTSVLAVTTSAASALPKAHEEPPTPTRVRRYPATASPHRLMIRPVGSLWFTGSFPAYTYLLNCAGS